VRRTYKKKSANDLHLTVPRNLVDCCKREVIHHAFSKRDSRKDAAWPPIEAKL